MAQWLSLGSNSAARRILTRWDMPPTLSAAARWSRPSHGACCRPDSVTGAPPDPPGFQTASLPLGAEQEVWEGGPVRPTPIPPHLRTHSPRAMGKT